MTPVYTCVVLDSNINTSVLKKTLFRLNQFDIRQKKRNHLDFQFLTATLSTICKSMVCLQFGQSVDGSGGNHMALFRQSAISGTLPQAARALAWIAVHERQLSITFHLSAECWECSFRLFYLSRQSYGKYLPQNSYRMWLPFSVVPVRSALA